MPTRATTNRGRKTRTAAERGRGAALTLSYQTASAADEIPARGAVRRWVAAALERPAVLTVRFVDEAEGQALNSAYRGKNYATNVLTFVYVDEPGAALEGDIVVCTPVVLREAREQSREARAHFAHLVVHGVLHLQGFDHQDDAEAAAMEMRETRILGNLGFPDPYAA